MQLAASWAYPSIVKWFPDYLVLGDDIVIADVKVAQEYKRIMSLLEVPLNESKGGYTPVMGASSLLNNSIGSILSVRLTVGLQ